MTPQQLVSNENIEIKMDNAVCNLSDGLARGIYVIARKCPHVHEMLGYKTVWDLPSVAFMTVCDLFGEEVEASTRK